MNISVYHAIEFLNLRHGLYRPLDRFMFSSDLDEVLSMEFPIPVLLPTDEKNFNKIEEGEKVELFLNNEKIGCIDVEEKFKLDIKSFAKKLYRYDDHPGYKLFLKFHSNFFIAGRVEQVPVNLKHIIKQKQWRSVSAFQTRNIPHLGHERLHTYALEQTDGLLLTPVLGIKNTGDFKNEVIVSAYRTYSSVLGNTLLYFVMLNMRYLGPREAVFHAIIRKNLGATHFIIGRDHAGIGRFYGPYEAQELLQSYNILKVIPAKEVFYCTFEKKGVFEHECLHPKERISGTRIRELIKEGKNVPYLRKEVLDSIRHYTTLLANPHDVAFVEKELLRRLHET